MTSPLVPGQAVGGYTILRQVGVGAMGVVYAARDERLGRDVALKMLSAELASDPGFRSRFAHEARILGRLDSPHVVQILGVGEHDGRPWIATQLVSGGDLHRFQRDRAPSGGGLPVGLALELVRQVASGVADAHEAGIVHRDIKPTNVLVRERGHEVWAWVCDFGIARTEGVDLTTTGDVLGTYRYMAPERHRGQPATPASDVYSLGCLLWAVLTGRPPYDGETPFAVAQAHVLAPIPRLGGTDAASRRIDALLTRSMAKDPADRHATAADLAADLVAAQRLVADPLAVAGSEDVGVSGPIAPGVAASGSQAWARPADEAETSFAGGGASRPGAGGSTVTLPVRRRRWSPQRVAAVVLVVGLGTAVWVATHAGGHSASAGSTPVLATSPSGSSPGTPTATPSPTSTPSLTPSPSPTGSSAPVAPAASVVCWDGSRRALARYCPVPSGPAGLAHVFPSFDRSCYRAPLGVPGKVEVFQCQYGPYLLRYSRWTPGADRTAYFDEANPGAVRDDWVDHGVYYGTEWTSYEDKASETQRYQWSATYALGRPFSVSVEGVTAADRAAGIKRLQATAPALIPIR